MQKDKVENKKNEHAEVELSRRGFIGRWAVGAFLSIGLPGVVHAAKSSVVKSDKNHRLARSGKSMARLPKHDGAVHTSRGYHQAGKLTERVDHHMAQSNSRVRDVYAGRKHAIHTASNTTGRHRVNSDRRHAIVHPFQNEPIAIPEQEQLFHANNSRFSTYRSLAFQNPHTGDKLSLTYFEKGRYLSDALEEISFLLRDYRTGDVHPIDPELLDQLHDLKKMLNLNQPFDVVCGYRSPLTNAQLHAENSGVASNSFHMQGRAVDIRIERFGLRRIHNAALAMHSGGVGYYPESNFIHLDTGTFRAWTL
ncbi:MAG: DUF882 domain-containing protein [Methylomonas sp.]|jgi:uncharacterized protein YcbK (DUF882 family)